MTQYELEQHDMVTDLCEAIDNALDHINLMVDRLPLESESKKDIISHLYEAWIAVERHVDEQCI